MVERAPVEKNLYAPEDPQATTTQSPQENYDEVKMSIHCSLVQILCGLKG